MPEYEALSPGPFGEWLREARTEKRWSQQQLADRSGVSQPQISNLEIGRNRNPQAGTRERLEVALGVHVPAAVTEETAREAEVGGLGALVDFDPHDRAALPEVPGVYVFYDVSERPVYVGKSNRTIRERVREHDQAFWFKRPVVENGAFIEIRDPQLCDQIEKILIRFLKSNAVLNVRHVDR